MTNDYERYNFWNIEMDQYLKDIKEKEKYNRELDEAVKRVRDGKSISHEDVLKEMKNW